ncbi:hypothetical protein VKT23_015514 [Stygiomarasmius scandens]|uniref:DUF6534 domain-containing protein n=1 Tax=Marasmiellus scandens TaxID=2682957 RepID=A0ABR1IX82_9AGAR
MEGLGLSIASEIQMLGHFTRISVLNSQITADAVLTFLCDGMTTFSLCYLLHRSRSGITSTNHMINKILVGILNRGGFNFALTIIYLILSKNHVICPAASSRWPNYGYFGSFELAIPSVNAQKVSKENQFLF